MSEKKIHKKTNNNSENKKELKIGKIASSAFVIVLAAATVFLSGIGNETIETEKLQEVTNTPPAIEYVVDLPEDIVFEDEEEKKQKKTRSKAWSLLSMPLSVLGGALGLLLKPLIGKLLSFVLILAAMFGVFCLILKILNPDKSLKELLTKKNILMFFCFAAVFACAYYIPDIVNPRKEVNNLIILGTACAATLSVILLCSREE